MFLQSIIIVWLLHGKAAFNNVIHKIGEDYLISHKVIASDDFLLPQTRSSLSIINKTFVVRFSNVCIYTIICCSNVRFAHDMMSVANETIISITYQPHFCIQGKRLYIVGIRKDVSVTGKPMRFPAPQGCKGLRMFLKKCRDSQDLTASCLPFGGVRPLNLTNQMNLKRAAETQPTHTHAILDIGNGKSWGKTSIALRWSSNTSQQENINLKYINVPYNEHVLERIEHSNICSSKLN